MRGTFSPVLNSLAVSLFLTTLAALCDAGEIYVAPNGSPQGDGSRQRPIDLQTALSDAQRVRRGDTVWLAGGIYRGPFDKPRDPSGSAEQPIIYRAIPGERVTLTADPSDRYVLEIAGGEYVWFWGFEVTVAGKPELGHYGAGVSLRGGCEIKLINLVIHDCPNRSGIGGSNLGSEFYGCIIYGNGRWADALAHGTYTQNRPEDVGDDLQALPWKIHRDCVIFNNFGWGMHSYATSPKLANLRCEGVVAYGNGMPEGATKPTVNFLAGGQKYDDHVVVRECFTYYPDEGNFKRGADLGYGGENGRLTIEGSYFVGGHDAIWIRKWAAATVTHTVFFTAQGRLVNLTTPAGNVPGSYRFEGNTYYKASPSPLECDGVAYDDLETWQRGTGLDRSSRLIPGRPHVPWVFLRPNQYEPDKAFLIVYNWPRTPHVAVDLGQLWKLQRSEVVSIFNVENVWSEAVDAEQPHVGPIRLPMTGTYAPEFACYLLVKKKP